MRLLYYKNSICKDFEVKFCFLEAVGRRVAFLLLCLYSLIFVAGLDVRFMDSGQG